MKFKEYMFNKTYYMGQEAAVESRIVIRHTDKYKKLIHYFSDQINAMFPAYPEEFIRKLYLKIKINDAEYKCIKWNYKRNVGEESDYDFENRFKNMISLLNEASEGDNTAVIDFIFNSRININARLDSGDAVIPNSVNGVMENLKKYRDNENPDVFEDVFFADYNIYYTYEMEPICSSNGMEDDDKYGDKVAFGKYNGKAYDGYSEIKEISDMDGMFENIKELENTIMEVEYSEGGSEEDDTLFIDREEMYDVDVHYISSRFDYDDGPWKLVIKHTGKHKKFIYYIANQLSAILPVYPEEYIGCLELKVKINDAEYKCEKRAYKKEDSEETDYDFENQLQNIVSLLTETAEEDSTVIIDISCDCCINQGYRLRKSAIIPNTAYGVMENLKKYRDNENPDASEDIFFAFYNEPEDYQFAGLIEAIGTYNGKTYDGYVEYEDIDEVPDTGRMAGRLVSIFSQLSPGEECDEEFFYDEMEPHRAEITKYCNELLKYKDVDDLYSNLEYDDKEFHFEMDYANFNSRDELMEFLNTLIKLRNVFNEDSWKFGVTMTWGQLLDGEDEMFEFVNWETGDILPSILRISFDRDDNVKFKIMSI